MKSGFIIIAGRPNAGKSTLINALVGEKVAIVSWRPQTTRNKILGVVNGDDYQIVFIDTPGIHKSKNQLSDYMLKSVAASLKDADGVLYLIDGEHGIREEDREFLEKYAKNTPTIVALNKQDAVSQATLFEQLQLLNGLEGVEDIIPISAKKGQNLDKLLDLILKFVPQGEKMFPDDIFTDKSMRFMASEIIREKALYLLDKEIPYGIGVTINKFEKRETQDIYDIGADIVCERQSHKWIIIGKQGETLKKIAIAARKDLEDMTGSKVMLTLFVKVNPDWRNSNYLMREMGYNSKDVD